MRRVSLLARRLTVAGQDGFNERHQPREHRPAPLGLLPRRRLCIGQGLTHLPPMPPSFRATPRTVPMPNSYSRRISSNSSTFALHSIPASCAFSRMLG